MPASFEGFFDLDELVQGKDGSVATFVARHGWEAFRLEEEKQLEKALRSPQPLVLALGGGTLERGWPIIHKFDSVQVCHLQVPFEACWQRLAYDEEDRPLARDGRAVMAALYEKRQKAYLAANFSVDGTRPPGEVALAILQRLRVA